MYITFFLVIILSESESIKDCCCRCCPSSLIRKIKICATSPVRNFGQKHEIQYLEKYAM